MHDEAVTQGPTIVVGRKGTVGAVHLSEKPCWPIDTTYYAEFNDLASARYAFYLLKTIGLDTMNEHAAVPGLNRESAHRREIIVHDESEQRAIAGVLGSLHDKIALNRRMNRTLEAMARALFKSWFVDFDPVQQNTGHPADTPNPVSATANPTLPPNLANLFPATFQNSQLGPIPDGWEVKSIGNAVECVGGGTPSTKTDAFWEGGTHLWATPKDLSSLDAPVLTKTSRTITDAGIAKVSSGLLECGTVLMSSRAPVGYLAIAEVPVAVNQGFIAMKPTERMSSAYLLNWCWHNMDTIKGQAGGTTFAEISKKAFRPIPALIPPPEVAAAFAGLADPMYDQITQNVYENDTLAALRDALLPKLLSGALSVADAVEEVAT